MADTDPPAQPARPEGPDSSARSWTRWIKWVAVGVVGIVALAYGAIFFYANVINDAPDELDEGDLGAALVEDSTPGAGGATPASTEPADDASGPADPVDFDGSWVATAASEFGYRVEEVLAGVNTTAVGRSNEIDGSLTIDGTTATAVDVAVDVSSIESDDSRRDGQFRGRVMSTDQFPTATFVLTAPIEFGSIPTGDETITATATGDLTLRGVTNSVTFDVTAQTTGGRIGVLGSIPVLFSDYGIDNPSGGVVTTEDNGLVEFVLVFERA